MTHWSMAGKIVPLGYIQGSGGMSVMVSIIAAFYLVDTTLVINCNISQSYFSTFLRKALFNK